MCAPENMIPRAGISIHIYIQVCTLCYIRLFWNRVNLPLDSSFFPTGSLAMMDSGHNETGITGVAKIPSAHQSQGDFIPIVVTHQVC